MVSRAKREMEMAALASSPPEQRVWTAAGRVEVSHSAKEEVEVIADLFAERPPGLADVRVGVAAHLVGQPERPIEGFADGLGLLGGNFGAQGRRRDHAVEITGAEVKLDHGRPPFQERG